MGNYGEAVELGYCRPVTFHRHEGRFTVDLEGGDEIHVSGHKPAELKPEHKRLPGLQRVVAASTCHSCGASFQASFVVKLDEALRSGAIVRGMDLAEHEVRLGEEFAPAFRERILTSGDAQLVRILKILPEIGRAHV